MELSRGHSEDEDEGPASLTKTTFCMVDIVLMSHWDSRIMTMSYNSLGTRFRPLYADRLTQLVLNYGPSQRPEHKPESYVGTRGVIGFHLNRGFV